MRQEVTGYTQSIHEQHMTGPASDPWTAVVSVYIHLSLSTHNHRICVICLEYENVYMEVDAH